MQDSTLNTSLGATMGATHAPSQLITKATVAAESQFTSPRSLTGSSLKDALSTGQITPEGAIDAAFPSPFVHISDISVETLQVDPLSTGFRILDDHLFLKKGRPELVVVGAGTSHGKSAFMLQIAGSVAKNGPVLVFSLEMDERDIKARLLAPRISIPLQKIMGGRVPAVKLKEADREFKAMKLHLCTTGKRDAHYIVQSTLDAKKRLGDLSLVVIDYLQLVKGPSKNTRTAEISEILGMFKELAKLVKCPILIGSQLNRECERRGKQIALAKGVGDYTPMNSDLMDSGSIEHDADGILFITRQYQYDRTRPNEADLRMTKNRAGKLFDAQFEFSGAMCSFHESAQPKEYPI